MKRNENSVCIYPVNSVCLYPLALSGKIVISLGKSKRTLVEGQIDARARTSWQWKIFAWETPRGDHYEFRMFTVPEMREFPMCETRARPSS